MQPDSLYIGAKLIRAFPCDRHSFLEGRGKPVPDEDNQHGYQVMYPDGYISWSPKATFENAYREVTASERELF